MRAETLVIQTAFLGDVVLTTPLLSALAGAVPPVSLGLTPEDRMAAERWLTGRGLGPGFVALAPGSIWGTKRWPYYPALAAAVEGSIVVLGSGEDTALAAEILMAAPGR